jgi:PAS domain S-box-containing protein
VSHANQALWLNAVPLLVVAAVYAGAAALRAPSPAVRFVFAGVAVASGTYGVVLAAEREPPVGGVWPMLGVALALGIPAAVALASGRRPAADATVAKTGTLGPLDDAERVGRALVQQAEEAVNAELACLMLLDEDARQATGLIGRVRGRDLEWFPEARIDLDSEPSGVATAAYEGAPFAVYDAKASKIVSRRLVDATGAKSVAFVPLIAGERVVAVLVVGSVMQPRAFGTDELVRLQTLALDTAFVLDRTRSTLAIAEALERERQQARVQRAFFRIAAALGQSLSLPETLEALALAANEAFGGAFAAVLMPRGSGFEPAASAALPPNVAHALADGLPEGGECLATAASDRRVLASRDVRGDDRFDRSWQELAAGTFRGLLAVPVASPRAERAGLVIVFFSEERVFTDEDLELARHLGDAARGALERSELFEAERTARALSQQLARTGGALGMELDPAAVLEEVVQRAPALLGVDACAVRTLEDDELVVSAASGLGAEEAIGTRAPSTAWLSGDVFQSRSPLAIEDASADERLRGADPILAADHSAFLGVPLSGPEGAPTGVLAVYARHPRTWRPEEVDALQLLAANTSAALANAELYSRVSLEKERSVAILANIADGIVAVDRDGHVVLWNAAAEQITGVPQEEAIGRTTTQVLQRQLEAGDDETRVGQRLVSIMRGGEEVWLSLSEAIMRDPLGAVAGRIFAFRDISADRMVEQIKSDFVAAVSHELRTPLTSIYGFAETLLRQDIPFGEDERRTFLGYIASESQRLTEIVDELLNVARLDAGDLQVELAPVDVGAVVSEVVGTVEDSDGMNGHRFEIDLPDEPLAAEADREKVRQVFNILVENALQYSPRGGTVTVGARRNADRVEVRVVDQGMGIPAAERERIFRKFYRAESAARDGAAGTGLGLFIARELVTAMGGRIWVDSTEGKGSSFAFELPAARE